MKSFLSTTTTTNTVFVLFCLGGLSHRRVRAFSSTVLSGVRDRVRGAVRKATRTEDAVAPPGGFDVDVWQAGGGGKGKPLSFDESCYALYWNDLPSLEGTECSDPAKAASDQSQRKVLRVDGYSFLGRMATYKYIIEHSACNVIPQAGAAAAAASNEEERSDVMKRVWGDRLERHFLWGYAALLDWEHRSGRLAYGAAAAGTDETCGSTGPPPPPRIATDSWWGYMNFCYSVCILLGAWEAGVLDPSIQGIELLDDHSNHLVRTDPIVRKTIREWSVFWKEAVTPFVEQTLELQAKTAATQKRALPLDDPRHERLYDAMNEHEWAVHSSVFRWAVFDTSSSSLPQRMLRDLPASERRFCVGFCKMVDLFAALNWRTDLTTTLENGPGYMPLGILADDDDPPKRSTTAPSRIEARRRKTVGELHNLCDTSDRALRTMASVWKRVGRWEAVRRDVGSMIHGLSHGSPFVRARELCRFAVYLCLPASAWEVVLWAAAAAAAAFSKGWFAVPVAQWLRKLLAAARLRYPWSWTP